MEVDLSLPAARVVRALDQLIAWRGAPIRIRCDNGPAYVSDTLQQGAKRRGIAVDFI
jgi:putative transposase